MMREFGAILYAHCAYFTSFYNGFGKFDRSKRTMEVVGLMRLVQDGGKRIVMVA